jgi:deoxyribodipyrimidine photo-lyase
MILPSLITLALLLQTFAIDNMLSRSQPKSLLTTAHRAIVWIRNEQRVHDNASFQAAKSLKLPVLCVYCFDPRHFERTAFGEKKTGVFRAKFLTQSIHNFRENLLPLGVNLLVAFERPESLFERLLDADTAIIFQTETAFEEKAVERAVEKISTSKGASIVKLQSDASLYHRDDIPFAENLVDMPDTFTPFKEKVEKYAKVRPLSEELEPFPTFPVDERLTLACSDKCSLSYIPNESDLGFDVDSFASASGTSGVLQFVGGETAALARISKWMFEDDRLKASSYAYVYWFCNVIFIIPYTGLL